MKRSLTLYFICSMAVLVLAEQPVFDPPILVRVNGEVLQTEKPHYACPAIVDLDADGLHDLVVGQFKNGSMLFLRNSGKPGAPEFKTKDWIMAGGEAAKVPGVW